MATTLIPLNGLNDNTPQPQSAGSEALQTQIFDQETIGSFIKESVQGIRRVEKETLDLFEKIRDDVLLNSGTDKMRIEDVILVAPIAKDYLQLLSQQADNRTKILKKQRNLTFTR